MNTIQRIFEFLNKDASAYDIKAEQSAVKGFTITKKGKSVTVSYSAKFYLTMALGYLFAHENEEEFTYTQAIAVEKLGLFLDCARNNVPTVAMLKKLALSSAFIGYNYLQLYFEDCIELEGEGYFGYMRGRFTAAEIKELDAFCNDIGVELTPCLQTLAHLGNIFRHNAYQNVHDCNDILLVDCDETYALIEKMFRWVKECFTTNRVNIGMDEAHMLGLGKYLEKFGYKERHRIIREHLNKVLPLAKKYGLEISLFSDMFFRVLLNGDYYDDNDVLKTMPEHIKQTVPEEVSLIYWDYYHITQEPYERMFKLHKDLTDKVIFAGGAWKWQGFAPYNQYSCETLFPAIEGCKKVGVSDVMLTAWGDDGGECSVNALFGAYFAAAEKLYENKVDAKDLDKLCLFITGYTVKEFFLLDLPNRIVDCDYNRSNPTKYLFFDDLFIGMYSEKVTSDTDEVYRKNAAKLYPMTERDSEYQYLFDTMYKLCRFMEIKATLAGKIRKAYAENDRAYLQKAADVEIPEAYGRLKEFYVAFRDQWEKESKPFGFEVQDSRIGGLMLRFEHVQKRIRDYLEKGVRIAELEEKFLPTDENLLPSIIEAKKAITPSQIS